MGKLVLLHKAASIYDDEPDRVYDFPVRYLKDAQSGVGDWSICSEPVKAGARGYFAAAKIARIIAKPGVQGRYLALIELGSFLPFDRELPRLIDGKPLESVLATADGLPRSGGRVQDSVRSLPEAEFAHIIRLGLPADLETVEARRYGHAPFGLDDAAQPFDRR